MLHAGQITTDTDIGSSRTYEEETTTIDSIARATNEDILRFGIFFSSSSVEKREAESGRRKFGSVRGKRRRANVVVATRGREIRVRVGLTEQVCVLRGGGGGTMRYHGEKRVCAHTSALEGEHLGRVQGHAEGGGTGGETWFSRRIRNGAHFGAETIVCKVGGGSEERGGGSRAANAVRPSLGVGTPWRRGLGSKARSVGEHARGKCVRNATRGPREWCATFAASFSATTLTTHPSS